MLLLLQLLLQMSLAGHARLSVYKTFLNLGYIIFQLVVTAIEAERTCCV
jgi:hypothetical protein